MAQAAAKRTEYDSAVNGSLAYDLTAPAEDGYFYSAPVDIPAAPRASGEVVASAPAAAAGQAVSPAAILGFVLAAALLALSLVARAQLNAASENVSALESRVSELQEEQDKLLIDYESAFNLTEIEDYAINELGMQKARSDQIYYVNSTAEDKAVILSEESGTTSLADRFGDFISAIVAYFS